jgi:hypothetical protein
MRRLPLAVAGATVALVAAGCGGPPDVQVLYAMCGEDGFTEYVPSNKLDNFIEEWNMGPCHANEPDHIYASPDLETPWEYHGQPWPKDPTAQ